jgi:hypothetical protein
MSDQKDGGGNSEHDGGERKEQRQRPVRDYWLTIGLGGLLPALTAGMGSVVVAVVAGHPLAVGGISVQRQPAATSSQSVATPSEAPATAAPTNLLSGPTAYVGTWRGSAHASGPPADFAVIVTIQGGQVGSIVGTVDRPSLSCRLSLRLDKATNQLITLSETTDPANDNTVCRSGALLIANRDRSKVVVVLSGNSLDWRDFENGDVNGTAPTATATLTKSA